MSATAFFVRTLLKATAIFLGTTLVLVNPTLEWTASRGAVSARHSLSEDENPVVRGAAASGARPKASPRDPGVRRQADRRGRGVSK